MATRKDKVFLQDWLSFHPYESSVNSDFYYLRLSNEILEVLLAEGWDYWDGLLEAEELKELACFIACYFEDVISGPGLWRCFTTAMEDLYDHPLPFFQINQDNYYAEEINMDDICFLLWYFVSMKRGDKFLVSPLFNELSDIHEGIMAILEREYEKAPENSILQELYTIPPDEDDFIELNRFLRWIVLESWLFFFHADDLELLVKAQIKKWDKEGPAPDQVDMYIYDITDSFVHSTQTSLLALYAKEWLALLAGKDHSLYAAIRGLGEKKSGYYLFEGSGNEGVFLFRHLATDKMLEVSERSMDLPRDLEAGCSVVYAGFIRWRDYWWLSGTLLEYSKNRKKDVGHEILKQERLMFQNLDDFDSKENKKKHAAFLKFNEGKPMVFRANMADMEVFVSEFLEYFFGKKQSVTYKDPGMREVPDYVPGMLFSSAVSGIHTVYGLNTCVPDDENPWYDEKEAKDDAERILHSPHLNGEWVHHLLANYFIPTPEFPGLRENNLFSENMDFMLRFWKRKAY